MSTPSNSSNSNSGPNSGPDSARRRAADRAGRDYTGFGFREVGSDDVLDRYLNKEITRESAAFRAAFVKREFRERLDEAEGMIGQLRKPLRTPDLSDAILGAVDARKSFVATGARRVVTVGRLAAAASVLLAVGGVVLIERTHPILSAFRNDAEPIGGMVGGFVSAASLPGEAARAGDVPSVCEDADHVPKPTTERVPSLMKWTLARLGRVESVEVRGCSASPGGSGVASASRVDPTGWDRTGWDVSGWNGIGWDRAGVLPVPDVASQWSVGFATFPTPDGLGAERRIPRVR